MFPLERRFQPNACRSKYLSIDEFGRMLFKLDGDPHGHLLTTWCKHDIGDIQTAKEQRVLFRTSLLLPIFPRSPGPIAWFFQRQERPSVPSPRWEKPWLWELVDSRRWKPWPISFASWIMRLDCLQGEDGWTCSVQMCSTLVTPIHRQSATRFWRFTEILMIFYLFLRSTTFPASSHLFGNPRITPVSSRRRSSWLLSTCPLARQWLRCNGCIICSLTGMHTYTYASV